jgi:GTP pyrophosphokinase
MSTEKQEAIRKIMDGLPNKYEELVQEAIDFISQVHSEQKRLSGIPMSEHLINVALIATEIKLDTDSVLAALLHQTLAPKYQRPEQIEENKKYIAEKFGQDVLNLITAVQEIDQATDESQIKDFKTFNRYLLGSAVDIRPLLIRICDSLDNARTVDFLPEQKRKEFCMKLLNIYSPLAEFLSIDQIKKELEEVAFKNLFPEDYEQISQALEKNRISQELKDQYQKYLETVTDIVGYKPEVFGRIKSKYSIYRKLKKYLNEGKGTHLSSIEDVLAFTILTQSVDHCMELSNAIRTLTEDMPEEFSDYISHPKANGYKALHITTKVPELSDLPVEIHILTHEMHYTNTYGPASHIAYKASMKRYAAASNEYRWVERIHGAIDEHINKRETERSIPISGEIFKNNIFVLTPKGMIIELEKGDTILDFAYRVHTQIGHSAVAGKINGVSYKPSHILQSGDVVEIVTDSRKTAPSSKSLEYVHSASSIRKIKAALKIKNGV